MAAKKTARTTKQRAPAAKKTASKKTEKVEVYEPDEIESELMEATGIDGPKPKEARQRYLARLTRAASKLGESEWDELGDDAQDWASGAAAALNEKTEIVDFSDYESGMFAESDDDEAEEEESEESESDDDEAEEEESEEEESESDDDEAEEEESESDDDEAEEEEAEEEEPAPKKKTRGAKKGATKTAKAEKPSKTAKTTKKAAKTDSSGEKRGAGPDFLRRLVCENPDISRDDAIEKTHKAGYATAPVTLGVCYYHTINTLAILKDLKLLKTPRK